MSGQGKCVPSSGPLAAVALLCAGIAVSDAAVPSRDQAIAMPANPGSPAPALAPTRHPSVPRDVESLWLVPSASNSAELAGDPALARLQLGVRLHRESRHEQALPHLIAAARTRSSLADYAGYYAALAELRRGRFAAARERFADVADEEPEGFLQQAVALGEAEAAEGLHDYAAAIKIYERLLNDDDQKNALLSPDGLWLDLATAAMAAGDRPRAANAYVRLYYDFPLSDLSAQAEWALGSLKEVQPLASGNTRYRLELGRAERLFAARRYADARTSFLRVRPHATDDDRELIALRLAETDYYASRYVAARDALKPYLETSVRTAEARFFYLMALRGLKAETEFVRRAQELSEEFPDSVWTEDALNNLATSYIQRDQEDEADRVLRDLYEKFPRGRYAERAAWKIGWRAYLAKRPTETAEIFERTAAAFPRSDYRPAYLYWSGRSREAAGNRTLAVQRYRLAVSDYLNTYYGRLGADALSRLGEPRPASTIMFAGGTQARDGSVQGPRAPGSREDEGVPPTSEIIRALLSLGLHDEAMNELRFAQRAWGESPVVQATMAWTQQRQDQLRPGINAMKRAYPQYMAAGGEQLPREILTVIFPIAYWDQIRKLGAQRQLDPYLLAALIAQESNFDPVIRSRANAYGLMQLLPSTARRYARNLKVTYSARLLTNPDSNMRLGTAYLADLIEEFGSMHFALAGYNAGEGRVRRWRLERPDLTQDEFIDDIPFPETQNYVKRVLGTAEDYRRLYGGTN